MKFNHFAVENDNNVSNAANNFLASKMLFKAGDKEASDKLSQAYLALVARVGASSPIAKSDGKSARIMVEKSRGTVMLSVPEGISLSSSAGLSPMTEDDYLNMRNNAKRALASPAAMQHPAPRGTTH